MPTFGDYETVGEPLAVLNEKGHVSTVWKARKAGGRDNREFVVKTYAPHRRSKEGGQEESLDRDRGLEFLEGVKQLKKAQSGGARHLSPVHDLGISSEGAWYVTDYYPRGSLMALIDRRAKVDSAALKQITRCIVAGCLALKKSRGVSHGNLKAGNVFLFGKPRPLPKTPLLLADPYPAAPLQLARLDAEDRQTVGKLLDQVMEAQDLQAIGEIILQLVERRQVRRDENNNPDYNYPIARSDAWDNLGKDGERWRQICNQLLDEKLSLDETNLESLAKKFPARASGGKAMTVAAVFVAICLIGGGSYGFVRWNTNHQREIQIQKRQKYEQFIISGRMKLVAGDYAGAKVDAGSALENQPDDGDAIKLRNDAVNGLENLSAAQRQKAYDAAMKLGRQKLDGGDFSGAMSQADIALANKPDDTAAKQLKADAKAKQDAIVLAEQKQKAYDAAMKLGRQKLDGGDFSGAMSQADIALANKPDDTAAKQLKADAKAKQDAIVLTEQKQKAYDAAMKLGRQKLDGGDFSGAMSQADIALANKPDDTAAKQLKADAKAKQDAIVLTEQKQKAYDAAMKLGRQKLDGGDFSGAMSQADIALANKPDDTAAKQLKADAKAKQDAIVLAEQKQKAYDAAMKLGRQKLDGGDFSGAMSQADIALANKPDDTAAKQLKADAKAKQDAIVLTEQKQKAYDAAMKLGRQKLDGGDFSGAMSQADIALANKPDDTAAKQLKADAKAKQDAIVLTEQKQKAYDAAMKLGRQKLDGGDFSGAMSQADIALANKPDDTAAKQLKADAKAKQDAIVLTEQKQKAYDAAMKLGRQKLDGGDFSGAMSQADIALANKPDDTAAKQLKADAQAKKSQLDALDTELEKLCIELRESKPSWLKMPGATGATPYRTDMPLQIIDYYNKRVDALEQGYKAGGWLNQNNRSKYISNLRGNLKTR